MTGWGRIAGGATGAVMVAGGALALYTAAAARRFEKAIPRNGRMIDVEGGRLHVVEKGKGPALLLIHGLGAEMRSLRPLLDPLSAQYRTVLVDRPGAGYSPVAASPQPSLADQARSLASLIDRMGLDRPLVIGHSLGGALALTLALNHPGSVGGLALVAPLTRPADEVPPAFALLTIRSSLLRALVAWTIVVPLAQMMGDRSAEPIFAPEPVPRDFATTGGGALALRPETFQATSADLAGAASASTEIASRLGEIDMPVGILFGDQDKILDPQRQGIDTAAEIRGATFTIMAGGHMIPYTQPQPVAAWIIGEAKRCAAARETSTAVQPSISTAT